MFDYRKLRGRIIEIFGSVEKFAKEAKMTATTIGRKLSGKSSWTQDEIVLSCDLLYIPTNEITVYFFTDKVEKTQQEES